MAPPPHALFSCAKLCNRPCKATGLRGVGHVTSLGCCGCGPPGCALLVVLSPDKPLGAVHGRPLCLSRHLVSLELSSTDLDIREDMVSLVPAAVATATFYQPVTPGALYNHGTPVSNLVTESLMRLSPLLPCNNMADVLMF